MNVFLHSKQPFCKEMSLIASYLKFSRSELWDRVALAEGVLRHCSLCPRNCDVDRTSGDVGFCRTGDRPFIASWGAHFGEERPLVGPSYVNAGSGTIFFSNCNLGCIYCQNWTISHLSQGSECSFERLASIMMDLQQTGCLNINLVTPSHQMPMILHSLAIAADMGLTLPIVYNCGGYESTEALKILDGIIDIYMPDFKYSDSQIALSYSMAKDYPQIARGVIKEMHRQVGDLVIDQSGVALRGVLLRHLVLPDNGAGTKEVVRFIAEEISKDTYINIMRQYHPCHKAFNHPPLDRKIMKREYNKAIKMALDTGLRRIDGVTV